MLVYRVLCVATGVGLVATGMASAALPDLSPAAISAYVERAAGAVDWVSPDPAYAVFERTGNAIRENGDVTLPILERLLHSAPTPRFAEETVALISLLQVSDRQEKVRVIKGIVSGEFPVTDPLGQVTTRAFDLLRYWGEPQDVTWALRAINSEFAETQAAAVDAIGAIGDRESGEFLMRALRERHARLPPEEAANDLLLADGERAVARIANRMAAKASSAAVPEGRTAVALSAVPTTPEKVEPPTASPAPSQPVTESPSHPARNWLVPTVVGASILVALLAIVAFRRRS